MVKKRTMLYLDDDHIKILKGMGYNLSGLVSKIFESIIIGEKDGIEQILKKDFTKKLEEIKTNLRPPFTCVVCKSQDYELLGTTKKKDMRSEEKKDHKIVEVQMIKCKGCNTRFVRLGDEWIYQT